METGKISGYQNGPEDEVVEETTIDLFCTNSNPN
jgi:hypothetical protein